MLPCYLFIFTKRQHVRWYQLFLISHVARAWQLHLFELRCSGGTGINSFLVEGFVVYLATGGRL